MRAFCRTQVEIYKTPLFSKDARSLESSKPFLCRSSISRTARASPSSEGGGNSVFSECGDDDESPGAGEATFSIQLSSSAFRASSKSVKATPMPIPILESRTITEQANSALFQLMQNGTF